MKAKGVLLVVLLIAVPVLASEKMSMRLTPTMSTEPSNLTIQLRVQPDDGNRGIEIVAESDDFLRSSLVQLDGANAPIATNFEYRGLPAGEYIVTATLLGRDGGVRARAQQHATVIEWGR